MYRSRNRSFVDSPDSRILVKWEYIQFKAKIMPVWPLCRESELILLKKTFRVGYLGLGVHKGKFSLRVAAISCEHTFFSK